MLMNVLLVLTVVILMHSAVTLLGAIPVPVTLDSRGMDAPVLVRD